MSYRSALHHAQTLKPCTPTLACGRCGALILGCQCAGVHWIKYLRACPACQAKARHSHTTRKETPCCTNDERTTAWPSRMV